MGDLGRMLIFVGGLLLVVGIILVLAGKVNLPIGRLPGDIVYRGKNTTFYFPLATSILLSVILSLVLVCCEPDAAVRPASSLFALRFSLVLPGYELTDVFQSMYLTPRQSVTGDRGPVN